MSDDRRKSAKLTRIEIHYESQSERLQWTNARYRRLCAALKLTEYEMGAFLRCRIADVEKWLRTNRYPPTVELHLTTIESVILPTSKPSVFPHPDAG